MSEQCFTKSAVKYRTPYQLSILSKAMSNVRAVLHQEHCQMQDTISAKCLIKVSVKCQQCFTKSTVKYQESYLQHCLAKDSDNCRSKISS